jgi:hypothetical protein
LSERVPQQAARDPLVTQTGSFRHTAVPSLESYDCGAHPTRASRESTDVSEVTRAEDEKSLISWEEVARCSGW